MTVVKNGVKVSAWRAAAGKLSARAENVLTNAGIEASDTLTPQELRANLLSRFGSVWPSEILRRPYCGPGTIAEIQRWIGDDPTAKLPCACVCRTCGRRMVGGV